MFKKKDHAMLEEAYAKVMMNEIHSNVPMDDEPENFPGGDGGESHHSNIENLCDQLKQAIKYGEVVAADGIMTKLQKYINNSKSSDSDLELEEPQSTGGNEGTGRYISNKQKSAEHKTDFYINRMNLKPGEDF
jgi:hypothetical protein